ncbi:uncharacterized protein LOC130783655 [Actinidia eriantha]|uniref:uncharacterized protein LOC130783655 n=1 Tax=Actinidia eriantha TaxID=165200 RepID=UPI002590B774|nr:uncharacterized protein LOC130783655 [Actinidia eriantha]
MVPPQNSSWTVRKLSRLQDIGHSLIKHVVEDGKDTFLWLDNCHPIDPPYRHFSEEVVRDLGCSLQARVSSIICNDDWVWPRQRNRVILHNMSRTPQDFKPIVRDKVLWTPSDGIFSVKTAWKVIRHSNPKVPWCYVVWFRGYVSRWAFIDWFCCCGRRPSEWSIELDWVIHNLTSVDFENNLYKLVMSASVYHIWGERTARIFDNKSRDLDSVFKGH